MKAIALGVILCLVASATASPRIVGGKPALNGKYPYQASLRYHKKHLCGGSIIDKRWILTAAHCLTEMPPNYRDGLTVVVGTNSLRRYNKFTRTYKVKNIVYHDGFNYSDIHNDIGLIQVAKDIKFNDKIQPVGLPKADSYHSNYSAVLTGWGDLQFDGITPDLLQELNLKIIDLEECKQKTTVVEVIDTQICTYNKFGQGACHGDSGGPLVANGQQIGIVSCGEPCAVGKPDVFTRVSSYIGWIKEKIAKYSS